jgi:microcystin-dependent protein
MAEAYVGQINLVSFNWAPEDWLLCQGQLLQVTQYQALFSLISNVFGGDGVTTFALPDLRGRVPVQPGQGPVTNLAWAEKGGTTATALQAAGTATISSLNQLPEHTHTATFAGTGGGAASQPTVTLHVSNDAATSPTPLANGYMAPLKGSGLSAAPSGYVATANAGTTALNTAAATATGGSGGGITGGTVTNAMTGAASPAPIPVTTVVNLPPMMPPFIGLNYIICVNGYYPSRP